LITAETYSKFIHPNDRSVRTIFGDAAAATLLTAVEETDPLLGPYVFGTDGSGARNLIVPAGGMRMPHSEATAAVERDDSGNVRSKNNLFMDGPEIFSFTLRIVPKMASDLLARASKTLDEIDLFVFHQANRHMLNHLRRRMKIPEQKFCITLSHCGNTVSCTIPIALKHAMLEGRLKPGILVMLMGFGVGYSWGACLVRWDGAG
jgi:3-oxoacyl-[acyl-carrier-protein] synthase-3